MYIAPIVVGVAGIAGLISTIVFFKKGGSIKIKTLLLAVIGIPVSIMQLMQIHGIINIPVIAKTLGPAYIQSQLDHANEIVDDEMGTPEIVE